MGADVLDLFLSASRLGDSKSCSKNLDEIIGVAQDADLPLDLGAVFVAWVGKDRQVMNSTVLRGQQHFFVHQVFETDER